jgi:hypothetical protein
MVRVSPFGREYGWSGAGGALRCIAALAALGSMVACGLDDLVAWEGEQCRLTAQLTTNSGGPPYISCRATYWPGGNIRPEGIVTVQLLVPNSTGSFLEPAPYWISLNVNVNTSENVSVPLVAGFSPYSPNPDYVPTVADGLPRETMSMVVDVPYDGGGTARSIGYGARGTVRLGANRVSVSGPEGRLTLEMNLQDVSLIKGPGWTFSGQVDVLADTAFGSGVGLLSERDAASARSK